MGVESIVFVIYSSKISMSESFSIRELAFEDLPMILSWRNHESIRRFMLTQHEIDLEEHRNWFSAAKMDATRRLLIVEDGAIPLGFVQLSHVTASGVADWGFYVRPDAPRGSGLKLGKAALNYAFCELMLHKICGSVIQSNKASISFHQRLGFAKEGVLRDQQNIAGVYHSLVCFGMIAHEWTGCIASP